MINMLRYVNSDNDALLITAAADINEFVILF